MRAVLRLGVILAAAGLALGGASALAQSVPQQTPPSSSATPVTDSVGPRDLQNFNLGGTVTRRAEPATAPAATAPSPPEARNDPGTANTTATTTTTSAAAPSVARAPPTERAEAPRSATSPEAASAAPLPIQPALDASQAGAATSVPSPAPGFSASSTEAPATLAPERRLALWPWVLAAIALGAGGAFLLRRNRARESYAGGPDYNSFAAPEPQPMPVPRSAAKPAPAPPVAAPRPLPEPSLPGLVTTRLRPWLDIGINPLRFVVQDDSVAIEFEVELFNSGNAPARAVLLEAVLLNAGPQQDDQLRGFFANPVGQGERIIAIPPMKRIGLKTQVAVGREHVQQFDIAGKKVCVPLLAINALYESNGKDAQTSASYLLGRETENDKLAPFRLDLGPRLFRTVGTRALPGGVRT